MAEFHPDQPKSASNPYGYSGSRALTPSDRSGATERAQRDVTPYAPGSELVKVNIETGEREVVGGRPAGETGLPSVTGGYGAKLPEVLKTYVAEHPATAAELAKQYSEINLPALKRGLEEPTQVIQSPLVGGLGMVDSKYLAEARSALSKPKEKMSLDELNAVISAASISGNYQTQAQAQAIVHGALISTPQQTQEQPVGIYSLETGYKPFFESRQFDVRASLPSGYIETQIPKIVSPAYEKGIDTQKYITGIPLVDISAKEYELGISKLKSQIEQETSLRKLVLEPNLDYYLKTKEKPLDITSLSLEGIKSIYGIPRNQTPYLQEQYVLAGSKLKDYLSNLYDFSTNVAGYTLSGLSSKSQQQINYLGLRNLSRVESEKLILPYKSALEYAKQETPVLTEQKLSSFYTGKLITEEAGFLAGGTITTLSMIGSAARAKTPEETILPILFGVGGRLATPVIAPQIVSRIEPFNENLQRYASKLLPRVPTLEQQIVPNFFPQLTESNLAKGILLGGAGAEVVGLQFMPTEYKPEYIRQIGLYNALTPVGFRAADVSLMLGKTISISALETGFKVGEKLGLNIRGFDVYSAPKLMSEDLMKTPTFVGTEKEMLEATRDLTKPGIGEVYKRFGINPKEVGTFSGIRSTSGKLAKEIEPGLIYYEGSKGAFFAPEINPIAMRTAGLRSKLFGAEPGIYSEYSLGLNQPSLEFLTTERATAVSLNTATLSEKGYEEFKRIYGYSEDAIKKFFSKEVMLGEIILPKGKTIGEAELEKILRPSRPLKSRELISLLGAKTYEPLFTDIERSPLYEGYGFISTPSRSLSRTAESEVFTFDTRQRVEPLSKAREVFRKLGFADAYVIYDFESIPLNYEIVKKSLLPVVSSPRIEQRYEGLIGSNLPVPYTGKTKQLFIGVEERKLLGSELPVLKEQEFGLAKGGYSQELEMQFGTKEAPRFSAFRLKSIPDLSLIQEVSKYKQEDYEKSYLPSYSSKYLPKYSLEYSPIYTPPYSPNYEPVYSPQYVPEYLPKYTPTYTPKYQPSYTPTYTPTYTPKYTPPYTPTYTPKYTPPYQPPYTPPQTPPYGKKYFDLQEKKNKKLIKGFIALTRRKGKFIPVSKQILPKGLAYSQAAGEARRTLARSITVKEVGQLEVDDSFNLPNLQDFRQPKSKSKLKSDYPIFVQTNALSSKSETTEIQQAKKLKRRFAL